MNVKQFITDLVCDAAGKLSHSKFWSNIAYGVCTVIVIWLTYSERMTVDYFIAYLSIAGGHAAVSKYIGTRTPQKPE